jgi:predicted HNH restriction endonuclease
MKRKYNKITDEELTIAVENSESIAGVLRYLGIRETGGSHSHYSRRIKKLGLDTQHFTGQLWNKGKKFSKKKFSEILIKRDCGLRQKGSVLTRCLIEIGRKHECEKCSQIPVWHDFPLTLDVDHINEDWLDDREENLRFLCPNCHSQLSRGLLN